MKSIRYFLFVLLCLVAFQTTFAQNRKFDKSLRKIDGYYAAGSFSKAASGLVKLKKSVVSKMGQQNSYMPGLYLREARINLSQGLLTSFETSLNSALSSSIATFGDNSTNYATTLIDVADLYNEYGNYRISREYLTKAKESLTKSNQMTEALKSKIALAEADAMIGQGFCNDAIDLLKSVEKHFASRAVEKETITDGTTIKSQRVPEVELPSRYGDYARLLNLMIKAYSKKGRISIGGGDNETADVAYSNARGWLRGKSKYLGETSLADVQCRYLYAKALEEIGTPHENELNFDNILNDLKKRTSATNPLAHDIYLDYLSVLLRDQNRARYLNTKLEYGKVLDKFPSASVHRSNEKAVEFNSKLSRDKTTNLEQEALKVLSTLPKNYKTSARTVEFLYDLTLQEKRYTAAESYLNQLAEIKKELCGETSPEYHLARIYLADFDLVTPTKLKRLEKYIKRVIPAWSKIKSANSTKTDWKY